MVKFSKMYGYKRITMETECIAYGCPSRTVLLQILDHSTNYRKMC